LSERKLTVQDIILLRKQFQAAEQLNSFLSEAVSQVGEAVNALDPSFITDEKAALAIAKIKTTLQRLEKEVDEFTKRLR
jgi:hypothetical protein